MLWTTVLAWLAASAEDPKAQGLILAAALLPHMLVLLLGGATTDRHGSARVATITTVVKAVLLVPVLAVSSGSESIPLLLLAVVAGAIGAVDGFHDPAMDAWGARMQRPDDQVRASAIETTLWRAGQFVGAALGGFLIGLGAAIAVAAAVSLYVTQRVLLSVLKRRTLEDPASTRASKSADTKTTRKQIRDGLRFLRGRPLLWAAISTRTVCGLSMGATLLFLLPRIVREQGWPTVTYGFAAGIFGAGLATGAWWVARQEKTRQTRTTAVPVRAFALTAVAHIPLIVIGLAIDLIGPVGLIVLVGLFGLALGPVTPLLLGFQRRQVSEHQQGIVAATARMFINGLEPLGPLAAGAITSLGSTSLALKVSAVLGISTAIVAAVGARAVSGRRGPDSGGRRRSAGDQTTTRH